MATAAPQAPHVSIAVLARNEGRYLAETLSSLSAQTHPNVSITVYDNASEDDTEAVARAAAVADPRIKVVRHPRDIGGIANCNTAFREAQGDYVLIAGGHDLFDPDYVERLVARLEANKKAVLAFGRLTHIDADGAPSPVTNTPLYSTEGVRSPVRRFNFALWGNAELIHGLIRMEAIRQTDLLPVTIAPLLSYLPELAILGEFVYEPNTRFTRRKVRSEDYNERVDRYQRIMFGPSFGPMLLPYFHASWQVLRVAARTPVRGRAAKRLRWQLIVSSLNVIARKWPNYGPDVRSLPTLLRHRVLGRD